MEITRLGPRKLYIFLIFEYSEIPAKPNTFGDLRLLITYNEQPKSKQLYQFQIKGSLAKNRQHCTNRDNWSEAN